MMPEKEKNSSDYNKESTVAYTNFYKMLLQIKQCPIELHTTVYFKLHKNIIILHIMCIYSIVWKNEDDVKNTSCEMGMQFI